MVLDKRTSAVFTLAAESMSLLRNASILEDRLLNDIRPVPIDEFIETSMVKIVKAWADYKEASNAGS